MTKKNPIRRADQTSVSENLSSSGNRKGAAKPGPALSIQLAAANPDWLSLAELPVLQQFYGNRALQRMLAANDIDDAGISKPKENRTGLPDQLKTGMGLMVSGLTI
jgi:hypothetical protein